MDDNQDVISEDKFHDECGVFAIRRTHSNDAAPYVYYGLFALQHRGQESAGIVVSDAGSFTQDRGMGLVGEVFSSQKLAGVAGAAAIGHVRYSTSGDSCIDNAQPFVSRTVAGKPIAVGHNGNLVNTQALIATACTDCDENGSDTSVILSLLAGFDGDMVDAVRRMSLLVRGAYSLVILCGDFIYGVRDPYGIRPLCLGRSDSSVALASESCALDSVGCALERDVMPGEIIRINPDSTVDSFWLPNKNGKSPCIFEHVYFARPDSVIDGSSVHDSRRTAGILLAEKDAAANLTADVVVGVPDSGTSAAIGYAQRSGVPYGVGFIKNRYIGRTFIQPLQSMREESVKLKLNPLTETVKGKRIVLIDDSIVRGTTSKRIVEMLRAAGAKEVHFRVSSPPIRFPCHFGIDTPTREELIASRLTIPEICGILGADTLEFLTMHELFQTMDGDMRHCAGCFDGNYPVEVPFFED